MIRQLDAIEFLKTFEPDSVDLIVTDPAYDTLDEHRNMDAKIPRLTDWFETVSFDYLENFLLTCSEVLKPGNHLYLICDWKTGKRLPEKIGKLVLQNILIWDKIQIGMGYHWRKTYEFIMFYSSGHAKQLNNLAKSDILRFIKLRGDNYYPTQKPPRMIQELIENSSIPGDLVIDPFCGSGMIGVAALDCNRLFQGSDISKTACELAIRNLKIARKEQLELI
jgi:site-specific DNA-methyltransferase (adenine-specific)